MKHSLHTVLTLLFVCASAWGENVGNCKDLTPPSILT